MLLGASTDNSTINTVTVELLILFFMDFWDKLLYEIQLNAFVTTTELFNDWGRRGYADSVPGEVTKTPSSGDRTT